MAARIPVALDVDTGVDDACALLLAALHPGMSLEAVTCVAGNASLPDVVRNTLTVLDVCGRDDVPVAAGAPRPLLDHPREARHVHGADGMGDLDWPRSPRRPGEAHAVELLAATATAAAADGRPLTLVPLAPLTNVALLARTHPSAFAALGRVVLMGGAADVGNATASAEFNVFHDPEAAAIVLDACTELGVPLTMYGLDVFAGPVVTREDAGRLVGSAAGGRTPARLAGELVRHQCDRFRAEAATIGDAGAVCAVLDPGLVDVERLPVRVELTGRWTRGRTVVDRRGWAGDVERDPHGPSAALADVALGVDGPGAARLWLDTVGGR